MTIAVHKIALARAIEASVDGAAPNACRIWKAGWNQTDKATLNFTSASAQMVMQAYEERGNPLVVYYEHEDTIPLDKRGGSPMRGVCAAPSATLTIRQSPTGLECWIENIAWTAEAKRQIESGERRQVSPIAAYDTDTREIVAIRNVSLVAEGATHNGTLLASRNGKDTGTMEEMIQQILDALTQGDFETAETLVQQMEAQAPDAAMTKMARAAMSAKPKPPAAAPVAPDAPPVVAKKMAALSRADVPAGVNVEAFNVALGRLNDATATAVAAAKRSDRQTVVAALSRAIERGLPIDLVDEREHVAGCDPVATEKFIASLDRKAKVGVIVASKPPPLPAAPAKTEPTGARTMANDFGLTDIEKAAAKQHGITFEKYAASLDRNATGGRVTVGVA